MNVSEGCVVVCRWLEPGIRSCLLPPSIVKRAGNSYCPAEPISDFGLEGLRTKAGFDMWTRCRTVDDRIANRRASDAAVDGGDKVRAMRLLGGDGAASEVWGF